MKRFLTDLRARWFFLGRPEWRINEDQDLPLLIPEESSSTPHKSSTYCRFCASTIKLDSNYCAACGKPLSDQAVGDKETSISNSESNKSGVVPKRRNFAWAGFVGFLIIFIFLFNVLASEFSGEPSPSNNSKQSNNQGYWVSKCRQVLISSGSNSSSINDRINNPPTWERVCTDVWVQP